MIKNKGGDVFAWQVITFVLAVALIALLANFAFSAVNKLTSDRDKIQAEISLERFSNYLEDLEISGDYAHFSSDTFLFYLPKEFYIVYRGDQKQNIPLECIDGKCLCICKEKDCSSGGTYCKSLDKPLLTPNNEPIQIGITEVKVIGGNTYVVSEVKESLERVQTYKSSNKNPNIAVKVPEEGFIPAAIRKEEVSLIILHHTVGTTWTSAYDHWKQNPSARSAHFLIDKDGLIYYTVGEDYKAIHAGSAFNSKSIGIELVNTGEEPFTGAQYVSLNSLIKDIEGRYGISHDDKHVIGHYETPQGQTKEGDPSNFFEWARIGLPNHITLAESKKLA